MHAWRTMGASVPPAVQLNLAGGRCERGGGGGVAEQRRTGTEWGRLGQQGQRKCGRQRWHRKWQAGGRQAVAAGAEEEAAAVQGGGLDGERDAGAQGGTEG